MKREDVQTRLQRATQAVINRCGTQALIHMNGQPLSVISTGCPGLDRATGVGGVPQGRIVEIFGDYGVGKTSLALHIAAEAKKQKGLTVWFDPECGLDLKYAARLGACPDFYSQPDTAEQVFDSIKRLLRAQAAMLIVIDSVAALCPEEERQADMGDYIRTSRAVVMSKGVAQILALASKAKTTILFINQLCTKYDREAETWYESTPGGRALANYAAMRIRLRLRGYITKSGGVGSMCREVLGQKIQGVIIKNSVGISERSAQFRLEFGRGWMNGNGTKAHRGYKNRH